MGQVMKLAGLGFYVYLLFGTSMQFDTWAGLGIVIFYLYNYVDWV